MQTARIRWNQSSASGKRTSWARTVLAIDTARQGARSFVGEYLRDDAEIDLPIGAVIIEVCPRGSLKNGTETATAYRVTAAGLTAAVDRYYDWHRDRLSFRDKVAELLEATEDPPSSELAHVSTDDLLAELDRRDVVAPMGEATEEAAADHVTVDITAKPDTEAASDE